MMRQQLDMRVAHVLDIGNQLRRQLLIIEIAAVVMPLPGAGVDLVDIDRPVDGGLLCRAGTVERVMPREAVRRVDDAGGLRQRAAAVAVGIGLVDRAAGAALSRSIYRPVPPLRRRRRPPTRRRPSLPHGKILCVPEIKIADDMDGRGVRRPDAEHIAAPVFQPVAAEISGMHPQQVLFGIVSEKMQAAPSGLLSFFFGRRCPAGQSPPDPYKKTASLFKFYYTFCRSAMQVKSGLQGGSFSTFGTSLKNRARPLDFTDKMC